MKRRIFFEAEVEKKISHVVDYVADDAVVVDVDVVVGLDRRCRRRRRWCVFLSAHVSLPSEQPSSIV